MELDIDLKKIDEEIKVLNKHIDEYGKADINFINILSKIKNQLYGDLAIYFSEKVTNEMKNNTLIMDSLSLISNFYEEVYSAYSDKKY